MTKFEKYGRTWYTTRKEVEEDRNSGERVYYDAGMKAYYIVKTEKRSFWGAL